MAGARVVSGAANGAAPPDAPAGSVLAQLRELAQEQREERTLEVPIGGAWRGQLVVVYGMPSMAQSDRLLTKAATIPGLGPALRGAGGGSGGPGVSDVNVDVMVTCCRTVLGRVPGQPDDDLGVGLTGELLELLQAPLPEGVDEYDELAPADVIGQLFEENWLAVGRHAGKVFTFLQDEDESGEAEAT